MQLNIKIDGLDNVRKAMEELPKKAKYATVKAMNRSVEWADTSVRREMRRVFDQPKPWVLQSLRIQYAKPTDMTVELAFKDSWSSSAGETGGRTMLSPHIYAGTRSFKGMEVRLMRIGLLPAGYNVVPGGGAKLDGYGNMSPGQISQLLNVLGAYTESGFNKANINTVKRLAKGNAKKNIYGFVYWVNKVGSAKASHLQPGVYQRVTTAFGSSLKPILIFVKQAKYKNRLDFYGLVQRDIDKHFAGEFDKAFEAEKSRTAARM